MAAFPFFEDFAFETPAFHQSLLPYDMDMALSQPPFFEDFDLEALPYIGLFHLKLSPDDVLSYLPHLPPQLKSSESPSLPQLVSHPYDSQSLPDAGIHCMGRDEDFAVFVLADLLPHPSPPFPPPLGFPPLGFHGV